MQVAPFDAILILPLIRVDCKLTAVTEVLSLSLCSACHSRP
jgi:hypothetical protein